MNMNSSASWSSLLKQSIRPYKGELAIVRSLAADPPPMRVHAAIVGVDEDVAALVALRGPAACKDFFKVIQPLMSRIGRSLSNSPGSVDAVAMATVFCLSAFSEAMGTPLESSDFDVDRKLDEILAYRDASPMDKVTAILICLDLGRMSATKLLPSGIEPATAALIKQLAAGLEGSLSKETEAAWDAYLRAFPRALEAETAEWRHLLLAARLALGKLGGVSIGEVAETLYQRIKKLAEEESA
jgi:hypothetical protein